MIALPIDEPSRIGEARLRALETGRRAGLDRDALDRLALIVTEIGTNLVRHAVDGEMLIGRTEPHEIPGCHVIGVDSGPGIEQPDKALEDGFSTATDRGGIGGGLGAIRRMSDSFDLHSDPEGTTISATIAPGRPGAEPVTRVPGGAIAPAPGCAGVIVPMPGTPAGGDGWAARSGHASTTVLLIDVLGHGPTAAEEAGTALAAFHEAPAGGLAETEEIVSAAFSGGRGAAIVLAEVPHGEGPLRCIGIGNIRGEVVRGETRRGIVSAAGIAGQMARGKAVLDYDWGSGATLILTTDGLKDRTARPPASGLLFRAPLTIAATLYRRRRRGTDDCGVVVVRAA